jgi:hypothetical protein
MYSRTTVSCAGRSPMQYTLSGEKVHQCRQLPGVPTVKYRASGVQVMVTVEEGAIGGFAAHVLNFLINEGQLDGGSLKFRSMMLPDR